MRLLSVLCVVVVLCGLSTGQVTVVGGHASYWNPAYDVLAPFFVPRVITPSLTLSTVSPTPAGASNATFGLVAGATNSTLSSEFVAEPPVGVYTEPVWYGESVTLEAAPEGHAHKRIEKEKAFDFIAEGRAGSESAARLKAMAGPARKASRTYTNQDIDQMNQKTGTVKYDGKTEHI